MDHEHDDHNGGGAGAILEGSQGGGVISEEEEGEDKPDTERGRDPASRDDGPEPNDAYGNPRRDAEAPQGAGVDGSGAAAGAAVAAPPMFNYPQAVPSPMSYDGFAMAMPQHPSAESYSNNHPYIPPAPGAFHHPGYDPASFQTWNNSYPHPQQAFFAPSYPPTSGATCPPLHFAPTIMPPQFLPSPTAAFPQPHPSTFSPTQHQHSQHPNVASVAGPGGGNAHQAFAAGAAWAAAQIAQAAADYANSGGFSPTASSPPWLGAGAAASSTRHPAPQFGPSWYPYASAAPPTAQQQAPPHASALDDAVGPSVEHDNMGGTGQSRSRPPPDHADSDAELLFEQHNDGRHEEMENYYDDSRRHRRKRQHRLPPPHGEGLDDDEEAAYQRGRQGHSNGRRIPPRAPEHQQQREKIRRRLRSDGESSSSGSSFYPHHHQDYSYHRHSSSRRHYKKKKARSDESLLGKTAVSALYEWCSKRQRTPVFMEQTFLEKGNTNNLQPPPEEFDFTVALNDEEDVPLGRGRGTTKSAAKQMAARRALQSLLPGVVFDTTTGILIELPVTDNPNHHHPPHNNISGRFTGWSDYPEETKPAVAAASTLARRTDSEVAADELAPNLAKRLAIGRDNHPRLDDMPSNNAHGGDLAPNLVKRLAIDGKSNPDDHEVTTSAAAADAAGNKKRGGSPLPSIKRSLDITTSCGGQSTTTSGDEEDGNTYYTGRGASVCSALLHAMVQIDSRIPEAPQYFFQVLDQTLPNLRRRVDQISESQTAIRVHRGPFSCTARLKLVRNLNIGAATDTKPPAAAGDLDGLTGEEELDGDKKEQEVGDESKNLPARSHTEEILEAVGIGGTKREARHVASAKLLALLFPECETMVEVKAAAEIEREKYAASKASKQQQQQSVSSTPTGHKERRSDDDKRAAQAQRPFFVPNHAFDHAVPGYLIEDLKSICRIGEPTCTSESAAHETTALDDEAELASTRQASRRKQLETQVEAALHALNEQDEEGRSLPAGREITADDVGRAVLRRATEDEDLVRMEKLFSFQGKTTKIHLCPVPKSFGACAGIEEEKELASPKSPIADPQALLDLPPSSSSGNSIVLLLCRAIAPHEDPPLGCAVLTIGFSMEIGRLLRIAKMAHEPHLPQERFLECLGNFAKCMKSTLVMDEEKVNYDDLVSQDDLRSILKAHLDISEKAQPKMEKIPRSRVSSPLQAVREESEASDTSGAEGKREPSRVSNPSKRTRVE
ncbi:hypothetical protein ACA910_015830 [Epithemia clementina (nom. ined.)]